MAYIYKIINDINDKVYIGKTEFSLEKRFKEHCKDAFRERNEKRPLYNAMEKYGIEHFSIKLIEETDNPEEREKYWINQYNSFGAGYNATLGGDGKQYCDYELIYNLFKQGKSINDIVKETKYDPQTCRVALNKYGISAQERKQRRDEQFYKGIVQLDKNTYQEIQRFPSIADAYRALGKQHSGHIASVCNGQRKTAYGYAWKYEE